MAVKYWHRTSLTGGVDGSLDNIDGALLSDGDIAYVATLTTFYVYALDDDSGAAESSPGVISPDSNAGNKRWILVSGTAITGTTQTSFSIDSGGSIVKKAATKTSDTLSKTIGSGGDYADFATAIAAVPDLLAHAATITIKAGTTLAEYCAINNKHGSESAAQLIIAAEKYFPTGAAAIPTADSATATTLVDADLATAAVGDDYFNGCWIFIVHGTGTDNGFVPITDYTDLTGTVTVASWPGTEPDNTSKYIIVGALIDATGLNVGFQYANSSCYMTLRGIGIKDASNYGALFRNTTGTNYIQYCGIYNTGGVGWGLYLQRCLSTEGYGCGLVGNAGYGMAVESSNWTHFTDCGISDNTTFGVLNQYGGHMFLYNNYGDDNGTYGSKAQLSAQTRHAGTECSGTSGNHTNGAGDGSLAY